MAAVIPLPFALAPDDGLDGEESVRGEAFHLREQQTPGRLSAGQLERLCRMLGLQMDEAHQLLRNVPRMLDVDRTDVDFLPLLAARTGALLSPEDPYDAQREEIKRRPYFVAIKGTIPCITAAAQIATSREVEVTERIYTSFKTASAAGDPVYDDFVLVDGDSPKGTLTLTRRLIPESCTFAVVDGGDPSLAVVSVSGSGYGPRAITVEVDLGTTTLAAVIDAINEHPQASVLVEASLGAGFGGTPLDTAVAAVDLADPFDPSDPERHLLPSLTDVDAFLAHLAVAGEVDDTHHPLMDYGKTSFASADKIVVTILLEAYDPETEADGFTYHVPFTALARERLGRWLHEAAPEDSTVLKVIRTPAVFERA